MCAQLIIRQLQNATFVCRMADVATHWTGYGWQKHRATRLETQKSDLEKTWHTANRKQDTRCTKLCEGAQGKAQKPWTSHKVLSHGARKQKAVGRAAAAEGTRQLERTLGVPTEAQHAKGLEKQKGSSTRWVGPHGIGLEN